jgi:hypothetical protein
MKMLIFFISLACSGAHAQEDSNALAHKSNPNSASLLLTNGTITKGWLYSLSDSQVVLLRATAKEIKQFDRSDGQWMGRLAGVPVTQIQSISLRQKNSVRKSALIGLSIGVVTGAITGLISGDDPIKQDPSPANDPWGIGAFVISIHNSFAMTAGEKALFGAAGLGIAGAITGAIIGALAKKKFMIGGKKEKFRDLEGELTKRLLIK